MAIASNFPSSRPSLLLDFASVGRLDPRVTFTRASTATYYDGVTTAKAEENLLLYSQEFNQSSFWVPLTQVTVSTNTTTAPDGTSTAETIAETTTTEVHSLLTAASLNYISGQSYAYSVFLKKGDGATAPDWIQLTFSAAGFAGTDAYRANFDLQNGVLGTVGASVTAAITSVGNGWYRCSIIATAVTTTPSGQVQIVFTNNTDGARRPSYTGQTTSNVFIWGAQLEQRSAVTAYTATTTQPITNYVPVLLTAQNDVSRFQHDPVTGASDGLMLEEQRTNLCLQSEDFSTTWSATRSSVTTNAIVAPNGTLTGDKLVEDTTASNTHQIDQTGITVVSGTTYAFSVYLKAAERTKARLVYLAGGAGVIADADLSAGTIGAAGGFGGGTAVSSSIQSVGNGWYRCTVVGSQSASTSGACRVELLDASGNRTYTGDGYSGIYIWGAQLEAGANASSYIPTTTTALTRSADVGDITGSNFTDFYNNSEGTFYVEGSVNNEAGQLFSVEQGNASASNSIIIGFFSGTPQFRVRGPSSTTQALFSLTASLSTNSKYAGAYATNSFNASANGSIAADDTSGLPPSPQDNLKIGRNGSGGTQINGTIKKIAYYPQRLSNAQLQALTA